jgi:predicted transcriptional regulator YheO
MYLHSTGSMYDAEKIYTPFLVYCKKYHGDDFKSAASDLYKQGYGSRFVKEIVPIVSEKIKSIEFPLEIFPDVVEKYILHCKERLMLNEDFMSGALLWMTSILIGNSLKIEAKKGWLESPILFIALVGRAGLGKTPSTKPIIAPVKKINQKKIEDYLNKYKEYERYIEATKKEQAGLVPIDKPRKKQILAEDTTIEALINLHNESNKSIGVFKDELDGWFKDMNKYRDGSDKQKWLSIWSNESIIVNRVSRPDLYIASPFISVMGGIQPTILDEQFTTENIANGFIDRFLFCYPEKITFEQFSLTDLEEHISEWWSDSIIKISDSVAQFIKKDENDNIIPFICKMSIDGFKTWIAIFNTYSSIQNSDDEIESNKSMIAKIKVYIPRFALIIHFLDCMFYSKDIRETYVSKETILKADLLAQYFINQFKKIKIDSAETSKIKSNISTATDNESFVKKCYDENPDFNRTKIAELLGISRQTIYKYLKK